MKALRTLQTTPWAINLFMRGQIVMMLCSIWPLEVPGVNFFPQVHTLINKPIPNGHLSIRTKWSFSAVKPARIWIWSIWRTNVQFICRKRQRKVMRERLWHPEEFYCELNPHRFNKHTTELLSFQLGCRIKFSITADQAYCIQISYVVQYCSNMNMVPHVKLDFNWII